MEAVAKPCTPNSKIGFMLLHGHFKQTKRPLVLTTFMSVMSCLSQICSIYREGFEDLSGLFDADSGCSRRAPR